LLSDGPLGVVSLDSGYLGGSPLFLTTGSASQSYDLWMFRVCSDGNSLEHLSHFNWATVGFILGLTEAERRLDLLKQENIAIFVIVLLISFLV